MSNHTTTRNSRRICSHLPGSITHLLHSQHTALDKEIDDQFTLWQRAIAALPLTSQEYCFLNNWLISAKNYWHRGELGAARYQLEMIGKRLRANDWPD
jgi:hypothetical protein